MNNQSILVENVPNDWVIKKIKYVFDERKETNDPIQTDVLVSLTHDRGVILHSEKGDIGNKEKDDIKKYKIVHPGDIVVNSMNVIIGSSGLSDYFGLVSPVYYMLVKKDPNHDNKFFHYLFRSIVFQKSLIGVGNGILEHRMRVPIDKLGGHLIPLPSANEQKLISRYLDKKTSQIDSLVEKIQKKIELLKEQRTSLVNHYVTKGLDPNVEMKDSGVEWIGEIPRHWTIVRLRFLCGIKTGGKDTQDNVENGSYPFFVRSPNVERINSFSFDGEAVLTSGDGAGVGKIFHYYVGKFDYHQRVYKFSNFKDVSGKYFYWFLKENFQYEILRWNAKSTVDSVRLPFLQNFPMVLPPIEEQENLLLKIDSIDDRVEKLIQRLMKKIDILKEYRQSLISSVVTGKVRVTEDMI